MKVPDKTAVELWSPQVCSCLCLFINFTLIVMQELHVFLASVPGLQRVAPFLSEVHFVSKYSSQIYDAVCNFSSLCS